MTSTWRDRQSKMIQVNVRMPQVDKDKLEMLRDYHQLPSLNEMVRRLIDREATRIALTNQRD